ncbi:GLPGLI family protein [Chryseobacterium sp. H1D6B]|uniref:GLPGLI family protein n=1 Tax=Chryseobacterium sp. H1D6B TaxID=2940588 RepID=UPI0015CCE348|nr:GLPGLI family protein [Chryseobacterium sp. H1D6B]MDH6254038.1 GLPGLI family protein [Chryseobacterium sp. H1D6B]
MKYYLLSLFFSFQYFIAQSTIQSEYEAIYKVSIYSDTLSKNNLLQEHISLLIKDNTSLFKSTQKAISDSIAMAVSEKQWQNPIDGKVITDLRSVPRVNFKDEVFRDNGKITIYKELLRNRFSFPLEEKLKWEIIEGETKTIESYICKKATIKYKNRNYIAWFTTDIPIPDGPYVFKGLPGLIMEIYDSHDYFKFSLISLKKVTKPMILMKDAFATDFQAYNKARKNFLDNPAGTISNQTGIAIKPQQISTINQNARRFNNYID